MDGHFQLFPEMFDWVQVRAPGGPLKNTHRVVPPVLSWLCALGRCPVGAFFANSKRAFISLSLSRGFRLATLP